MQEKNINPAKSEFLIGIIAVNLVFASPFVKSFIFFTSKIASQLVVIFYSPSMS